MVAPILEMRHITKRFPGVIANDRVDLTLYPGEVHALLGENGAGKSTLMNVLTGIYAPNEGTIAYRGQPVDLKSPKTAVDLGIGMVHQHFKLIEPMTVTENIYLASADCKFRLDLPEMNRRVRECAAAFHMDVEPTARIWQLSVGEQQRVEILKLLFNGAELLILDEPTAVLTPQESRNLFRALHAMADEGKSILFITHKMFEVMTYSDRITVLRDGKSLATMLRQDTDEKELTHIMVGRELEAAAAPRDEQPGDKPTVLRLDGVCALNDRGLPALDHLSLELKAGEILGIAGVAGNGQRELCEAITGLRPVSEGHIWYGEEDVANLHPAEIIDRGIAFIPEDRMGMGLAADSDIRENVILRSFRSPEIRSRLGLLKRQHIDALAQEFVERYEIKTTGLKQPVSLMSGGNLQKLLVAREVHGDPKVIVAAYPVHGVDIGATNAIHEILLEQRAKGAAVLLISEDLAELFLMADRVAALFEGRVTGVVTADEFSFDGVGSLMVGGASQEKAGDSHD